MWLTPEEFASLAEDSTDKALRYINARLYENMYEQMIMRVDIDEANDEETLGDLEWRLKGLRQQESSLQRLQSGLQSRLRLGN